MRSYEECLRKQRENELTTKNCPYCYQPMEYKINKLEFVCLNCHESFDFDYIASLEFDSNYEPEENYEY